MCNVFQNLSTAKDQLKPFAEKHKCSAIVKKVEYNNKAEYSIVKVDEGHIRAFFNGSTSIVAFYSINGNRFVEQTELMA